jgi:catechol 2,3-dioxygenase-like lactoylglutathione lyase family enzyme
MSATRAYLDHAAIFVREIEPHVIFFREVFGMDVVLTEGETLAPRQVWVLGGIQFIRDEGLDAPAGRLAHLGLICEDRDAAIAACIAHGARPTEKGRNWLLLRDDLCLELLQAEGDAVRIAHSIDPRA